jgi:hypothetical protein
LRSCTPHNPDIDPARLAARSGRKLWWCCGTCGHEWQAAVSNRTRGGTGCPVCGLKRRARTQTHVEPARSLAVKHPAIAAELPPARNPDVDPTRLGARSSLKLWWRCRTCGPRVADRRVNTNGRLGLPRLLPNTATRSVTPPPLGSCAALSLPLLTVGVAT